jgi:hypothetical protein
MRGTRLALASIAALSMSVASARAGSIVFSDETFDDAHWNAIITQDSTPGMDAGVTPEQILSGGNPDAFRQTRHDWDQPGGLVVLHLRDGAIYDPSTSGAIDRIDTSFDLLFVDGSQGTSQVGHRPAFVQDGLIYSTSGFTALGIARRNEGWQSFVFKDLGADVFPLGPDFSATGSPIQFGYLANNSGTREELDVSTTSGIDNWSITVHQLPEPGAPALLILFGALLARRACSDSRGADA